MRSAKPSPARQPSTAGPSSSGQLTGICTHSSECREAVSRCGPVRVPDYSSLQLPRSRNVVHHRTMRIVQLTPGTGSFHCGACIRDNTLVTALRELGHDAVIVPLYLPMTLDEPNPTPEAPLLFGGINVYLQHKSRLFRKTPAWVDRLLNSPALLKSAAKRAGMTSAADLGALTLSTLRGEEGLQAKEVEKVVGWLSEGEKPDVVCLSNVLLVGLARRLRQATGAAVVCTLQGEDSFLDSLPEPERTQCWETLIDRCREVDAFIPPSRYYGEVMTGRLRLPPENVHVVHNGINLDGYAPAAEPPDPPVLGFFARQCHNKGLGTLVEAYLELRRNGGVAGLKFRVAGTQTAEDATYVAGLRARLSANGLGSDVEFLPNLDRDQKIAFLRSLSVLSVPATYGESFGLYVVEALAAGVPVVQPHHAAFPELVEITGGGVLCEPDDPVALARAVEGLLRDPAEARAMGERGRQVVLREFSARRMAEGVVTALVCARGGR
ncbi:MAG: glycosyl transferase group 1 [Armatimonadetes bacterium CG_4_10_14_0_8_um_filter_66_14]|nr:MAG: glycosyl transferase group 1 [Armatimonadetes bacterium CG_4_10_14_0_8_um_filter_66_14]